MSNFFNFYHLPTDIKSIIFQKNRDTAQHRRQTRWMHHELSTIQFFRQINDDTYDDIFLYPSDLFERQDAGDLNLGFLGFSLDFPYYHDEEIHENKFNLHKELMTMIREIEVWDSYLYDNYFFREYAFIDDDCEYAFIDE
jgi:hypothetical protein